MNTERAYKTGLIHGALAVLIAGPVAMWIGYNVIGPLIAG